MYVPGQRLNCRICTKNIIKICIIRADLTTSALNFCFVRNVDW